MEPGKVTNGKTDSSELITGNKVDEPIKKEPDEEKPSILGTEPDLLEVPPAEEDKAFSHLKDEEGLLDEEGKVDDGLFNTEGSLTPVNEDLHTAVMFLFLLIM